MGPPMYQLQADELVALEELADSGNPFFESILNQWYDRKSLSVKQYEAVIKAAKRAKLIPED